jgi:hypothetical protein
MLVSDVNLGRTVSGVKTYIDNKVAAVASGSEFFRYKGLCELHESVDELPTTGFAAGTLFINAVSLPLPASNIPVKEFNGSAWVDSTSYTAKNGDVWQVEEQDTHHEYYYIGSPTGGTWNLIDATFETMTNDDVDAMLAEIGITE